MMMQQKLEQTLDTNLTGTTKHQKKVYQAVEANEKLANPQIKIGCTGKPAQDHECTGKT